MLPARFHDLRNRVVATVDQTFAEPVRLSPMAGGRTDPDRAQHVFETPLRVGKGESGTVKGGGGKAWNSRVAAGQSYLAIDPRTYVGPPIRVGDKIRAISRPGEAVFEVSRIDDRDDNRHIVELNEA